MLTTHASSRSRRALAALAGLSLGALLVACETEPPPPRALVIRAMKGQTQADQNRDKSDCQSMASAQASSSGSWAQIFASCMEARGYLVQ